MPTHQKIESSGTCSSSVTSMEHSRALVSHIVAWSDIVAALFIVASVIVAGLSESESGGERVIKESMLS